MFENEETAEITENTSFIGKNAKCPVCNKLFKEGDEIYQSFRGRLIYIEIEDELAIDTAIYEIRHISCE